MALPMQGKGRGGGYGDQANWMEEAKLKIQKEAEGVSLCIPPYFQRFDAIGNEEHPSIFRPRRKPNHHVAVAVAPTPTTTVPAAQAGATPTQPPLDRTEPAAASGSYDGREPAQSTATAHNVIVAAVGPYHGHHSEQPPLITHAKKCAIVMFLAREGLGGLDTVGFLGWARANEARARGCYERGSFSMGSEDFAQMLLLDGCLLLLAVFLLRSSVGEDQRPAELARSAEHGREFIYLSADISLHMKQTRLDMLMLGNQIPFFVLAELHRRLKGTFFRGIEHTIQELALSCFDDIHPRPPSGLKQNRAAAAGNNTRFPATVHHLLHLFHWSRVPRGKHGVDTDTILLAEPESHLPCATELGESLTRFSRRAAPGGSGSSLDIVFQSEMLGARGVMRVPALSTHGYSESVFRSLIAFEQSHLRCGLAVTAYCICMARLLRSEADARLMRKSGVLTHTHNTDQEAVDLFRGLADEYSGTFYSGDLVALCKDVAAHHRSTAARAFKGFVLQCFPKQTITFFVIFGSVKSPLPRSSTLYTPWIGSITQSSNESAEIRNGCNCSRKR